MENNQDIENQIRTCGWYDTESTYLALKIILELRKYNGNIHILDLGSEPGYYSIPFSRYTDGNIHTFIDEPEMLSLLKRSLQLNHIHNVKIYDKSVILSELPENGVLSFVRLDPGSETFLPFFQEHFEELNKCRPVIFLAGKNFSRGDKFLNFCLDHLADLDYRFTLYSHFAILFPSEYFWHFYPFLQGATDIKIKTALRFSKSSFSYQKLFNNPYIQKASGIKKQYYSLRWKYKLLSFQEEETE